MSLTKVLSLLVVLALQTVSGQLSWELVNVASAQMSDEPQARSDAGLGYDPLRHRLIIFGGQTLINGAKIILGDTWIYDIHNNTFREVRKKVNPLPRYKFVYGVSQDCFYIATGQDANYQYMDDIWRFDLLKEEWENVLAEERFDYLSDDWTRTSRRLLKPSQRYGAAGGIYPNSTNFYVSMGLGERLESSVYTYSTLGKAWYLDFSDKNPYNPSYPHARYEHSGTMMASDQLLIFGGCLSGGESGGSCPSSDSWVFDGQAKSWTNIGCCASPRKGAGLAMLPAKAGQRRAVLYGGVETGRQVLTTIRAPPDQLAVFNPDTETWSLRTVSSHGQLPGLRSSAAMATSKDGIYMFGGMATQTLETLGDLWLLRGDAISADQTPESGRCNPTFFSLPILHGILMVIGWGFFLPWGGFIARYTRHKSPKWFYMHILFQIFGVAVAVAGLVCAIISVRGSHFHFVHGVIGLIAMALAVLQPLNAILRPSGNALGEPKTLRRLVWEIIHQVAGSAAVLLGLINVSLGVFFIHSTMVIWALWFAYLCIFVVVVIVAELNHRWQTHSYGEPHVASKYVLSKKNGALIINDRNLRVRQSYHNSGLESEG